MASHRQISLLLLSLFLSLSPRLLRTNLDGFGEVGAEAHAGRHAIGDGVRELLGGLKLPQTGKDGLDHGVALKLLDALDVLVEVTAGRMSGIPDVQSQFSAGFFGGARCLARLTIPRRAGRQ